MANIQLYVENQLCDYDDKTFFSLQKEFSDEKELVVKEIEYSYTISIPTSSRNRRIFGYVDEFDAPNKFSRVFNAELYVDEILILKGKLKLNSIDGKYFKGNLYNPALATVSDVLGDRMLNEIQPHMKLMNNLLDYSATNKYVSGLSTIGLIPDEYKDMHICFPYILYGLPFNLVSNVIEEGLDFYTQDLEYGKHTITADNIFPSFNVLSVLKDMFETEGYKLQGNVFENDKFTMLYQTFQGNYNTYIEQKQVPYYLSFSCNYQNYHVCNTPISDGPLINPRYIDKVSRTLSVENMWTEEGFDTITLTGDGDFDGTYRAGVDNPLLSDTSTITINKDEQHMMSEGTESGSRIIMIPKSGWYKIHCDGTMNYPMYGSYTHSNGLLGNNRPTRNVDYFELEGRESIGVCIDEADCTTLKEQPFEFQIKKGYAKSSPNLYSFNGGIPCMPKTYSQFTTTKSIDNKMYIKFDDRDSLWYYGKNGKQTLIKNYSDFDCTDLLIGARLGGAAFDTGFQHADHGDAQRHNRFAFKGALLALPRADRGLTVNIFDGQPYYKMAERDRNVSAYYVKNEDFEYAASTAQILLRADDALTDFKCFSNFDGYNKRLSGNTWDTTTNYNARTFPTDDTNAKYYANSASTTGDTSGSWNMNTVVWLEKGEYLNIEVVMPWHDGGRYISPDSTSSSEWTNRHDWVNATDINFKFEIGLVSTDKNWYPSDSMKIPTFENLSSKKETNVNQFLPNVKCNDYLNNFLQTFNLQLTHPSTNVFSIDYAMNNDVICKIIDLDIYANKNDAEFKSLDIPSTRQLSFKIDNTETGYADGNPSPYKTENAPWYESGYTGSLTLTNEANTSGKIDKKESNWSYCWYKTIKFLNDRMYPTGTKYFDVPVIANKSVWSSESSYGAQEGQNPTVNLTSRFFLVKSVTNTETHKLIRFKYDRGKNPDNPWQTIDYECTLIIPTNFIPVGGQKKNYILDYDITNSGGKATITDTFFRIQVQSGYEINVPVKLPNDVYRRINSGTLIKFNDGLYKVSKIEGHDVKEQDEATITLITLT